MTLLEVKAFLQGISLGIGDRAPTYAEWKALLEHIDKNTVTVQPYISGTLRTIPNSPNILVGGSQFGHPGVPASAAKNY
jgi:hypothetical protein